MHLCISYRAAMSSGVTVCLLSHADIVTPSVGGQSCSVRAKNFCLSENRLPILVKINNLALSERMSQSIRDLCGREGIGRCSEDR